MVDRGLLGLFKRRKPLLHADPRGRDLSLAMRDAVAALERDLQAEGERFDEAVRRKRQDCGLPVPLADRVLPLRSRRSASASSAERGLTRELERDLDLLGREPAKGIGGTPGVAWRISGHHRRAMGVTRARRTWRYPGDAW